MQRPRMELLTIWSLWSEVSKAVFYRRASLCTIKSLPLGSSLRPSETVDRQTILAITLTIDIFWGSFHPTRKPRGPSQAND